MGANALRLGKHNWQSEVLSSPVPVLVDFWAEWCPPCKLIGPSVESLALKFQGQAKVGKLDVDAEPEIAGQFGIQSIPTLLVFQGGKVVDQKVGAGSPAALERFLSAHLTATSAAR